MTELTSNARFIQGINMLTAKIQDPVALEALVKAMEACLDGGEYGSSGVDGSGIVEAPVQQEAVQPNHPLEDYQITEKDVGSLVSIVEDCETPLTTELLAYNQTAKYYPYACANNNYKHAKPHLDTIALHFIPFYATEDSVPPDDLGDDYFAVLYNEGSVLVKEELMEGEWRYVEGDPYYIIGYRPLKFVNPLE